MAWLYMTRKGEQEGDFAERGEISVTSVMQTTPHLWQKVKRN